MTLYGRILEETLRIEHRHSDGTWSELRRVNHDVSAHDPEREWAKGATIYSCTSCDEMIRIKDPNGDPDEAG
jgi:hypothetical protein